MWPIVRDFFTKKAVAVRTLRLAGVAFGTVWQGGHFAPVISDDWRFIGYFILAVSALVTQQSPTLFRRGPQ